jgi:electron transport complex protein RnfG
MSTTTKMIIVLTVITIFSGGILSTWDGFTKPKIEAYKLQELKKAIAEVLPPYDEYEEINKGGITFYIGKKMADTTQTVGIAFEAVGNGFQGKISIMLGLRPDFSEITGIKILEQIETPGLGTKIVEDPSNKEDRYWFSNQFKQLKTEPQIEVVKNVKPSKPAEIQAITGATISSKAVVTILNNHIQSAKTIYISNSVSQIQ